MTQDILAFDVQSFVPDFQKSGGLLPAIAQDALSGVVLMLAWMNEEAWHKTLNTGEAHYFSRSRQQLWHKGESSGHVQTVRSIRLDCDNDTILLIVDQKGAACHTGYQSCFYRAMRMQNGQVAGDVLECSPHLEDE